MNINLPSPCQKDKEKISEDEDICTNSPVCTSYEKQLQFAPKKQVSVMNRPMVEVTTSMIKMKFNERTLNIYKYDITMKVFTDGVEKNTHLNKDETITVFKNFYALPEVKEVFKGLFWSDYKSLFFSAYSIPKTVFTVPFDEQSIVQITITPTETITIRAGDSVSNSSLNQAISSAISYETMMKKGIYSLGCKLYCDVTFPIDKLIHGKMGISYAFRMTERGPMLAIDQCASAFINDGPLISVVKNICKFNFNETTGTIGPSSLKDLTKYLANVKVYTTYQGYNHNYTIRKFSTQTAATQFFTQKVGDEEKKLSVEAYFRESYSIELKYPNAPLVETTRKTYIPFELLYVKPNQRVGHLLTPNQVQEFIKNAARSPKDNLKVIENYIHSDTSKIQLLNEFNIELGNQLEKVKGSQLQSPVMKCGPVSNIYPCNGSWKNNNKFELAKGIQNYIVVDVAGANGGITSFFNELKKIMCISPLNNAPLLRSDGAFLEQELHTTIENGKRRGIVYNIIFFFISGNDPSEYKELKRLSDSVFHIPSQCVIVSKMTKLLHKGYVSNIALKINAKLGGKNSVCQTSPSTNNKLMVCGADVTHPMIGEKSFSVASVVGSYDTTFTKYAGDAHVQARGKEVIVDMVSMMETLFNTFYQKNKAVPVAMVFYRDGVGEGMYELLLKEEIPKIFIAFHRCFPTYPHELKLTFVVCQKRHSVKFFPDPRKADKNGNAQSGLVVDKDIVSNDLTEFYLQSQETIKGTGRPCRYITLYDDNDWKLEKLESFTYAMCHLFNRCNRAISIAAPARYAHHLCFRVRDILKMSEGDENDMSNLRKEKTFLIDSTMTDNMFYV